MADLHIDVTRVTVCLLPPGHVDHHLFAVQVESRDLAKGLWAVMWVGQCLSRSGEWDYEPLSRDRTDRWLAKHRFSYEEAMSLAKDAAMEIRIMGRHVQNVLKESEQT